MKTLNVDGIDRDIDELIRDKVKIRYPNAHPSQYWVILDQADCADNDFWSFHNIDGKMSMCFGTSEDPSLMLTYKDPAKKLKLSDRLDELTLRYAQEERRSWDHVTLSDASLMNVYYAVRTVLDEVAYEKE